MGFRLSQAAQEDVTSIAVFGIERFGIEQAHQYHMALFQVFDLLAENPRMARDRREIDPPVRAHPFKSHVVIYRIDGPDILIIRVRHGSEDWRSDPE